MLVAGSDRAWNALPEDLCDRLPYHSVSFPALDAEEATRLDRSIWRQEDDGKDDDDPLFRFTTEGIRAILRLSYGNMRSLLQLCSKAFGVA